MPPTAIALLAAAALYVGGTFLARRLRDWHAAEWMHLVLDHPQEGERPAGSGEALGAEVMRFIRDQAEAAALAKTLGGRPAGNPHAPGTRAYVLWETSHHARLIYLTAERNRPSGPGLADSIREIRSRSAGRQA